MQMITEQLCRDRQELIDLKRGPFQDQYTLGPILKLSAMGEERTCWTVKDEYEFHVKIVRKENLDPQEVYLFEYELSILKKLRHPNIMQILEIYEDEKNYFIVSEAVVGQDLYDWLLCKQNWSEKDVQSIVW